MALNLMAKYNLLHNLSAATEEAIVQYVSQQFKSDNVPLVVKVVKNLIWVIEHENSSNILHNFPGLVFAVPSSRKALKRAVTFAFPIPKPNNTRYITSLTKLLEDSNEDVQLRTGLIVVNGSHITVKLLGAVFDCPEVGDEVVQAVLSQLQAKELPVRQEVMGILSRSKNRRKFILQHLQAQKKTLFIFQVARALSYNWSTFIVLDEL